MNASPRDSGSTWVSIGCAHCRHHYLVRQDAPPETRACPLCRQRDTRRIPGFRIRALMESAGGAPPDPSPSPSG